MMEHSRARKSLCINKSLEAYKGMPCSGRRASVGGAGPVKSPAKPCVARSRVHRACEPAPLVTQLGLFGGRKRGEGRTGADAPHWRLAPVLQA